MKNLKEIREADLYQPVSAYLTALGFTVKGEVKDCDLMAMKGELVVLVELKKSFNLEVLMQAVTRQRLTEHVYIAVPKPKTDLFSKRWKNIYHIVKRLSLGLIFVSWRGEQAIVEVVQEPAPFDREKSMKGSRTMQGKLLKEFEGRLGGYNIGGINRTKLMTAYKEMTIHVACCMQKYGTLSSKQLIAMGTDVKKTYPIVYNNVHGWFEKVDKGLYTLTQKGQAELLHFPELVCYYEQKLKDYENK
ncbi:MAG: hypothetical protein H7Y41_06165 [Hyphomonadaceae bacterium]|nr:hypothetical protein [Clostridia bacterium]